MSAGELLHDSLPATADGMPAACSHMLRHGDGPGTGLRRGYVLGIIRFYGLRHDRAIAAILGHRGIIYAHFRDTAPDLVEQWGKDHDKRVRVAELIETCTAQEMSPEEWDGPPCPFDRIALTALAGNRMGAITTKGARPR